MHICLFRNLITLLKCINYIIRSFNINGSILLLKQIYFKVAPYKFVSDDMQCIPLYNLNDISLIYNEIDCVF